MIPQMDWQEYYRESYDIQGWQQDGVADRILLAAGRTGARCQYFTYPTVAEAAVIPKKPIVHICPIKDVRPSTLTRTPTSSRLSTTDGRNWHLWQYRISHGAI